MKIVVILLFFLMGCSHVKHSKEETEPVSSTKIDPQDEAAFEQAFADMGRKQYGRAVTVFEKLADKYKNTHFYWPVLFNLTNTYKELNQCEKAASVGQKLIGENGAPVHLKARVYLHLAYMYECQNQPEQVLRVLQEGIKYNHFLTEGVRLVEYPGRLALAHIRLNQNKKGQEIYKQIYNNLDNMKKSFRVTSEIDKIFSHHFYMMGRSYAKAHHVQLKNFLKVFPYHQFYLTQSILLESGKWSEEAEKELISLYRKLWTGLKKQKDKSVYAQWVKKNLNELKMITRKGNTNTMNKVYAHLRRQTNDVMAVN